MTALRLLLLLCYFSCLVLGQIRRSPSPSQSPSPPPSPSTSPSPSASPSSSPSRSPSPRPSPSPSSSPSRSPLPSPSQSPSPSPRPSPSPSPSPRPSPNPSPSPSPLPSPISASPSPSPTTPPSPNPSPSPRPSPSPPSECAALEPYIATSGLVPVQSFDAAQRAALVSDMVLAVLTCPITSDVVVEHHFLVIAPGGTASLTFSTGVGVAVTDAGSATDTIYIILSELRLTATAFSAVNADFTQAGDRVLVFAFEVNRLNGTGELQNSLSMVLEVTTSATLSYVLIFDGTTTQGAVLEGAEGSWAQTDTTVTLAPTHTSIIAGYRDATAITTASEGAGSSSGSGFDRLYLLFLLLLIVPALIIAGLAAYFLWPSGPKPYPTQEHPFVQRQLPTRPPTTQSYVYTEQPSFMNVLGPASPAASFLYHQPPGTPAGILVGPASLMHPTSLRSVSVERYSVARPSTPVM